MARLEFSRKVRNQVFDRANGRCENKRCGAILKPGEGEYDHILPAELGGDASVANCMLICRPCHKAKTAQDIKRIRKSDRQRDKARGTFKRKASLSHPFLKKCMDGTVVDRRTGEIV